MVNYFITHQWKYSIRSQLWQVKLVIKILLGIMFTYFLLSFAFIGFMLDKIVVEIFPDISSLEVFNSGILYFFLIFIFMRFLLQSTPAIIVQPYLHLPIKKNKIVHFLLGRSLLNVFNFIPISLCAPFAFKVIISYSSISNAAIWLSAIILITLSSNYFMLYLKQQLGENLKIIAVFILSLALIIALDYFDIISLSSISQFIFGSLLQFPILIIFLVGLLISIYYLNYSYFISRIYLDLSESGKTGMVVVKNSWLHQFGLTGRLLSLELKLIFRNKRPKGAFFISFLFYFIAITIIINPHFTNNILLIMLSGLMLTGCIMFNYGLFTFSWENSYFDFLLAQKIGIKNYHKSKYFFFDTFNLISLVVVLPIIFLINNTILYIMFCCLLFNMGVGIFLLLLISAYSPKRINIKKGVAFNQEGTNQFHYFYQLLTIGTPIIIYLPFGLSGLKYHGIAAIGIVGAVSMVFTKRWINFIVNRFEKRKYIIAEGLRGE